jgi:LacI family transcriptional regulator
MIDRKRGYEDVLKEWDLYNPSLIKEINYSSISNDIAIAMESLLSNENRVDAIFYATNTLSLLGIKELMNLNVKIPEEVKVVCFDKNDLFDFTHIQISYIQQPIPEMGKTAVKLLIEQIKQKSTEVKVIELPTSLMNTV